MYRGLAAFQRVFGRAQHRALELSHSTITGLNILEAILFETESQAARFLAEQGITRQDILNLIAHGKAWHRGQEFKQQWLKLRPALTRRLRAKRRRLALKARSKDMT